MICSVRDGQSGRAIIDRRMTNRFSVPNFLIAVTVLPGSEISKERIREIRLMARPIMKSEENE